MTDPTSALTTAIANSIKVANTPLFLTVIGKMLGFKISEWGAQGEAIKRQILDGYEEAKQKGMGIQHVSVFRENANVNKHWNKSREIYRHYKTIQSLTQESEIIHDGMMPDLWRRSETKPNGFF